MKQDLLAAALGLAIGISVAGVAILVIHRAEPPGSKENPLALDELVDKVDAGFAANQAARTGATRPRAWCTGEGKIMSIWTDDADVIVTLGDSLGGTAAKWIFPFVAGEWVGISPCDFYLIEKMPSFKRGSQTIVSIQPTAAHQ